MKCSRCGTEYPPSEPVWLALDAVVHADEGPVCENCEKDTDVIVDL